MYRSPCPPSLVRSHLAQNPFICDCNLKWLADYLRSNPIETSGARCASPRRLANKRIGQIKSKKFRCSGMQLTPPPLYFFYLRILPPLPGCHALFFLAPLLLLGVALISLCNERSSPAKGFIWPVFFGVVFFFSSPAPQSISLQMNQGLRREGLFAVSPFPQHITTL